MTAKTAREATNPVALPAFDLGGLRPTELMAKDTTRPLLAMAMLSSSPSVGVKLMVTDSFAMGIVQLTEPDADLPTCELLIPKLSMLALEVRGGAFTVTQWGDELYARRSSDGSLWPLERYGQTKGCEKPMDYAPLVPEYRSTGGVDHPAVGFASPMERVAKWCNRTGLSMRLQYPEHPHKPIRIDLVNTSSSAAAGRTGHLAIVMPVRLNGQVTM